VTRIRKVTILPKFYDEYDYNTNYLRVLALDGSILVSLEFHVLINESSTGKVTIKKGTFASPLFSCT